MSEYEKLSRAVDEAFRKQRAYEAEGVAFGLRVAQALQKYLDCPADRLRVLPENGGEPGKMYSIHGAVRIEDDGYFHFAVGVTIGPGGYVRWPLRFRKLDGVWHIGLSRKAQVFKVDDRTGQGLAEAVAKWVAGTHTMLGEALKAFVEGRGRPGPVGFQFPESESKEP